MTTSPTVTVTPKPIWRSLTFWTNLALFLAAAGPLLSAYVLGFGVGEVVASRIASTIALVSSVINVAIRVFRTSAPIAGSPAEPLT